MTTRVDGGVVYLDDDAAVVMTVDRQRLVAAGILAVLRPQLPEIGGERLRAIANNLASGWGEYGAPAPLAEIKP